MEVATLVDYLLRDGQFEGIITNRFGQFGVPEQRSYLGATIMPENTDIPLSNQFRESFLRYRSNIANASTRYSPPQMKGSTLVGSMLVELGDSDIAAQFDAGEYDTLIRLIENLPNDGGLSVVPMQAMLIVLNWFDKSINRPLIEYNEKMIWDCIVDAKVICKGENNYQFEVDYPDTFTSRVSAGGDWGDTNYDPFPDILAGHDYMVSKGYRMRRQITSTPTLTRLLKNPKMAARVGIVNITNSVVAGMPGILTKDALNALMTSHDLPPIEVYDLQYQTSTGTARFLKPDVFVQLPGTDRDVDILGPDGVIWPQQSTLGYLALGRPTNRAACGRAFDIRMETGKAAPIEAEGWQTSLPVNMFPDAPYVIKDTNHDGQDGV